MPATAAAFAALASLAVYVLISVLGKRDGLTISSWFREAGKPWMAIVSLTACNITLGTGISYIITQAAKTGWLVLLTPLSITIGYFAIAEYFKRLGFRTTDDKPDLYYLLARQEEDGTLTPILFQRIFTGFIVVTYFLILAFELGVGSSFIGSSLLAEPSENVNTGIAILVFGIVLTYTAISGVRGAIQTDVVQIVFIVAFVAIVTVILFDDTESKNTVTHAPITSSTILAAILAIITAVSTQFYNIVNPQIVAPHPPNVQARIYRWAGVWSGLIYLFVATIGLMAPSRSALETSIRTFLYAPSDSVWTIVFAVAIFAGMIAVLLSTLDNLAIALSQLVYDMTRRRAGSESQAPSVSPNRLRAIYVLVGLLVIPAGVYLYLHFTSNFYLLLTILFAITTLSPFVFTAMFLKAINRSSLVDSKLVVFLILGSTAAAWAVYVMLNRQQSYDEGAILHLFAFSIACITAVIDVSQSKPSEKRATWRAAERNE